TFSLTPTTPKVNQSVAFKDESTGSPTNWTWDFGDGTSSTQQNPTKTYTKAGNYTVKLTITKQGATEVSTTKSVTIAAEANTLTLSATTRNAPVAGEQGGLNISTNTNWTASSNAAWLKVSPVSGNAGTNIPINYTVEANAATAARTGGITFTAGTQTATFTVTQAGVAPSLVVNPATPAIIAAAGSTVALSVVSNLSWSVAKSANSDWLTVSPASGMGNQNVSVTASANATTAERSATLTFSAAGVANVVVTIRQAGVNVSLSLSETSIKVNASPISIGTLKLTTNTAWTASSDAEWLTIGPTSGNAGTNIELTWSAAVSTSVNSRTGKITVMAGTQTATFTVTQAGIIPEFSLSAESKTVAATGEAGQLGITSNVPWTAVSNVTWLTFSPSSGGAGVINNFRYGVDANPNTTARTGAISFSAGGLTKAFTITQEGTKPTLPQAPTQLTVTATSESELRISWKDNANNETSYELERADGPLPTNSDFKKIATFPANTTAVLDQKLTSKSQYCYRVRAVNAVGASEFSETACGITTSPPAGITLLVHGFNPSDEADFKENFAVIAQAIKERAGAGATVYTNDPKKGTWRKWELVENNGNGDPTKEIILFYNWAVASNNELLRLENLRNNLRYMSNSGYLEGAADILFAMLADAQIPTLPNNLLTTTKPLHFIGHSRGTVLLLQLMHRMAKWFPNVKIDHYTALDPHPATTMGDVVRQQENTYSSLPLIRGIASNCTATIGCSSASSGFDEIKIRIPENVLKAEAYYRKDGDYEDADKVLENILQAYLATPFSLSAVAWNLYTNRYDKLVSAFDGVPSIGGVNHQLDNTKISVGNTGGLGGAHSGVVSWYFGTIKLNADEKYKYDGEYLFVNEWYGSNGALLASKSTREKSGYYFSRVGGGYAQLPDATEKVNLAEMDRQLSIRPRVGNADGGMKLGVQNGNFEYNNDSGWQYGGGSSSASTVFKDGKAQGKVIKNETQPFALTHSLMFFQNTANYLQINTIKATLGSTKISIQFLNRDLSKLGQAFEIPITDAKVFVKIPTSLKGKSGSFIIEGSGIALEKVELSDRSGSLDLFVELLAHPETPVKEAVYEVYPNPNNGRFSLTRQGQQAAATSITVVDVMGNILFKATENQLSVFNTQQKLDIALPVGFTGSYTLRVETAQGVSFKRIIKE
ncbi:MAG: BACON domain-containing protein, partial [Runella zeae]